MFFMLKVERVKKKLSQKIIYLSHVPFGHLKERKNQILLLSISPWDLQVVNPWTYVRVNFNLLDSFIHHHNIYLFVHLNKKKKAKVKGEIGKSKEREKLKFFCPISARTYKLSEAFQHRSSTSIELGPKISILTRFGVGWLLEGT